MSILRQAFRGCGSLPHVGSHPGTEYLVGFVLIGFIAGYPAGIAAAFGGGVLMLIGLGAIYLAGAIDRANISDRIEADRIRKGDQ